MEWILNNIGTAVVLVVLLSVIAAIIRYIKKEKAAGKTSCGCGCKNCAMNGHCHK